ncbi:DUF3413 domain-containing protein [Marinomonas algicola]|uniref:DUF3413 domain-containing protein n=1 Tax=Marinomonas algicola TaxID=2773454 RepID=UPI00174DFCD1|nr:DUF3413 domain-containing protein [Marinomonas algicola]
MIIPNLTRLQWFKVSWLFSLSCIILSYGISLQYLSYIHVSSTLGAGYLSVAFIGQIGILGVILTLPISLLVTLIRQKIINTLLLWLSACSVLLLLTLDTQIYSLYRFHLSGFIWNLAFGEGGSQIIHLSWYSILLSIIGIFALCTLIFLLLFFSIKRISKQRKAPIRIGFTLILISFLSANGIHIWFDAHGNTEIRAMTRHIPLYQPATAVRFMAKHGWIDAHQVNQQPKLNNQHTRSDLSYPTTPFKTHSNERQNVIFITVDAWRADAFEPVTTPNTFKLTEAQHAQYFKDHHSGGNVTKGGIFSLFYALPATYWDAFTAAQHAPVFFQTLQNEGYNTGIFGSGPLINPSFHRNVFSSIQNLTTMTEGNTAAQRDLQMVKNFQTFLDQNQQEPFIGFLFFDAAHGYAPPEDYEPKFKPYWDRVDHVKLGPDFDPIPYKNRYRTALHFVDAQIKNVIDDLKKRDLYSNSIIVITSDHGEEFNETKLNYWGHGSNFTPHQTQVPLLIIWPKKPAKTIEYRTSHYDIVPTILQEAFSVKEPIQSYSSGHSLFEEGGRDWLLVHSYFNYGVIMPDRLITTFPTGQYEITDPQQQPSNLTMPAAVTIDVLKEISRFYK